MTAKQSTNWFWSDWAGDQAVRSLTPAERGLWIDLLALAATGNPTGYVCDAQGEPLAVEQIARFANCSAAEAVSLIDGILKKGVASRDRTGRLLNRRMVRDLELSVKRRRAGKAGGYVTAMKWHAKPGVPGQVPGQVPRHLPGAPGTRLKKSKIIKTFSGAAREGSPMEPRGANADISPTDDLASVLQKKGWVP